MKPKEQLDQMVGKEYADKWVNMVKANLESEGGNSLDASDDKCQQESAAS